MISQSGQSVTTLPTKVPRYFVTGADGFALAQHSDLSWVTAKAPAHPGETIYLHTINMGTVVNPPATGHPTPVLFSVVEVNGAEPRGPIVLDTKYIGVYFGLHLGYTGVAAARTLSVTLTPGTFSKYTVAIRLPASLPIGSDFHLDKEWIYCPGDEAVYPYCLYGKTEIPTFDTTAPIHIVSP